MYRRISIQSADFSLDQTLDRLKQHSGSPGGVCFFVGTVRDTNLDEQVSGLFLEHYPGTVSYTHLTLPTIYSV